MKGRKKSGILCNKGQENSVKFKRFYKGFVRLVILYGTECRTVTQYH